MSDKIREEFETAYAAEQKEVYTAHGEDYFDSKECFLMHEDGFYLHDNTQSAWWGWKASRESLVVELPSLHPAMNTACDNYRSWMNCFRACKEAIESLGLRVKP